MEQHGGWGSVWGWGSMGAGQAAYWHILAMFNVSVLNPKQF